MEIRKVPIPNIWEMPIFKVPTPLMLDKIVTTMDAIYEQMEQIKSADTRGDVYEYLLFQTC